MFCSSAGRTLKVFALILVRIVSNDILDVESHSYMLVHGFNHYRRARLHINKNVCPILLTHTPLPLPLHTDTNIRGIHYFYFFLIGIGLVIFSMEKIEIYRHHDTLGLGYIYKIWMWTCST